MPKLAVENNDFKHFVRIFLAKNKGAVNNLGVWVGTKCN